MACPQAAVRIKTGSYIAQDARADHGTRLITLTADMIRIERVLSGMKMRVHIPAKAYFGVTLVARDGNEGEAYEVKLSHRDPELSVVLDAAANRQQADTLHRQWVSFFDPTVLDSKSDSAENELLTETPLPQARRRCMTTIAKRRPRRAIRRKGGNLENFATIRRDEREIICYE